MLQALAPLASLGLQGYGLYQQYSAGKKQEKYLEDEKKKVDQETRRAALARAIGASDPRLPREQAEAPTGEQEATKKGIADILNYSLNDYMANPEKYKALMSMLTPAAAGNNVGGAAVDNMYAGMA